SSEIKGIDENGRFLPRWSRSKDDPNLIELRPYVEVDSSLAYLSVKGNFKAGGENPCLITEAHERRGQIVVEGVCPIVFDNRFVGAAGVARMVTSFRTGIRALETPYQTANFFLLSQRGRVITTTLSQKLDLQEASETPYAAALSLFASDK